MSGTHKQVKTTSHKAGWFQHAFPSFAHAMQRLRPQSRHFAAVMAEQLRQGCVQETFWTKSLRDHRQPDAKQADP